MSVCRKRSSGIDSWEAGLDVALDLPLEVALERFKRRAIDEAVVEQSFLAFQARLADLQRQLLRGRRSVVLDGTLSRDGLLEAAMNVLDSVLAPGAGLETAVIMSGVR